MNTFKEFKILLERKFNIDKLRKAIRKNEFATQGSLNTDQAKIIIEIEKNGWFIDDAFDAIVSGNGFEITITNKKTKERKSFVGSGKTPILDSLNQALKFAKRK